MGYYVHCVASYASCHIVIIAIYAVNGQNCTGAVTSGSLSHHSNHVVVHKTFILAGYAASCSGTVVAWEFCYRVYMGGGLVTFYPGIWRVTGTSGDNTDYELVQSNSVTYNLSNQISGIDSCQRVNLSTTDQFTAPAGSVVGLYSNIGTTLLRINDSISLATYQFHGNQSSISINDNSTDNSYNIAIRVHIGKNA